MLKILTNCFILTPGFSRKNDSKYFYFTQSFFLLQLWDQIKLMATYVTVIYKNFQGISIYQSDNT